jgi:hypothetical protein
MKKYEKGPRRPWQRFYDSADWRDTSNLLKSCNPICQRILPDGSQCNHPPTIGHHLVDPRVAPALRLAFSNLVAVCAAHHPGGQPGANDAVEVYCHTIGPLKAVYKHTPNGGYPCWHENFNPAEVKPPSTSKSTIVGDAALDAAIAAYSQKLSAPENGN